VNIFQNSKWKQEYATELNNRFKILENMEDEDNIDNNINTKWENKTIIKETMTNERVAKTIYKWKPYATRPKGRGQEQDGKTT